MYTWGYAMVIVLYGLHFRSLLSGVASSNILMPSHQIADRHCAILCSGRITGAYGSYGPMHSEYMLTQTHTLKHKHEYTHTYIYIHTHLKYTHLHLKHTHTHTHTQYANIHTHARTRARLTHTEPESKPVRVARGRGEVRLKTCGFFCLFITNL